MTRSRHSINKTTRCFDLAEGRTTQAAGELGRQSAEPSQQTMLCSDGLGRVLLLILRGCVSAMQGSRDDTSHRRIRWRRCWWGGIRCEMKGSGWVRLEPERSGAAFCSARAKEPWTRGFAAVSRIYGSGVLLGTGPSLAQWTPSHDAFHLCVFSTHKSTTRHPSTDQENSHLNGGLANRQGVSTDRVRTRARCHSRRCGEAAESASTPSMPPAADCSIGQWQPKGLRRMQRTCLSANPGFPAALASYECPEHPRWPLLPRRRRPLFAAVTRPKENMIARWVGAERNSPTSLARGAPITRAHRNKSDTEARGRPRSPDTRRTTALLHLVARNARRPRCATASVSEKLVQGSRRRMAS